MKKSIRSKILAVSLSVCLIPLLLSAAISLLNSSVLTSRASRSNREIGIQASDSSERLLIEQAISNATEFAVSKAANVNLQISGYISVIESLRDYTEGLYTRIDTLTPVEIPTAYEIIEAGGGDALSMQRNLAPGTALEAVRDEIGFYGNLEPAMHAAMMNYRQITSIYVATESGLNIGFDANARNKTGIGAYEGRTSHWYMGVRENGAPYISDVYQDVFGRGLTITISVALEGGGIPPAVIGMDILIEDINRDILQTGIGKNGYALLIGNGGSMISAPMLSEQGEDAHIYLGTNGSTILSGIMAGAIGAENTQIDGKDVSVVYAPIGLVGWVLAVVTPLEDIIAPANHAKSVIGDIMNRNESEMKDQNVAAALSLTALFTGMAFFAALVTFKLSGRIIRPIIQLCGDIKRIGDGNLDYACNMSTGDELEELGKAFEAMVSELKEYIRNLASVTADKERIATELNVATRIQVGMLPYIFPPFPDREEFEIFASMRAAKEVGGDFYDFFFVDENRLALVIADVSGKGVPAALFMVIAKTLIKNYCQMGLEPAAALEAANGQLCENNEAGLFVTAFLGLLELDTGRFTYANAGHNPPLISRKDCWKWLEVFPGFVLAGMEGMTFKQQDTYLSPGDKILLYTDGVTEAQNPGEVLYSDERLHVLMNKIGGDCDVERIVEEIIADIDRFAADAPQADDITVMALKYDMKEMKGRQGDDG